MEASYGGYLSIPNLTATHSRHGIQVVFRPLAAIGLFSVPLASTVFYSSCDQWCPVSPLTSAGADPGALTAGPACGFGCLDCASRWCGMSASLFWLGSLPIGSSSVTCFGCNKSQSLHGLSNFPVKRIFLDGGAMNFIEKSAIAIKGCCVRAYRSCPNFAQ
jgi:hypothetical protein